MLKELIRGRLIAAADEIFGLFQMTVTSYEEELSRTREENERQRRQLEAFHKPQVRLQVDDVQQPPHIKEETEELWIAQKGECPFGPEEADLTKSPPAAACVKTEDPEDVPQADHLLAPLSDSDDTALRSPEAEDWGKTQELLSSDTDCEGGTRTRTDNKSSECAERETGKERFACPVCAKSFYKKSAFTRHMRTHTGEKPFRCSVCDKRFSQKVNMDAHMRMHTGEKPFRCSVCDKRFCHNKSMVSHMRTHTGEKPFNCSFCGKSFSYRYSLTQHMRKHTGEKPYTCSVCGKSYFQKKSLTTHLLTHDGE
ncbi:zinc finger protein 135-like isoform X5 [Dunckerocampus dactyliophorus]|uniref:zinc finger protein 135-like isoform X5 n=1 Tax=Dunckerocampus dactyliophorus TaxID=161453 RepID=UPI0024052B98|nr:zinc finger protein 135-like isoform X5 [Dunckerocampus dactyliophorus]